MRSSNDELEGLEGQSQMAVHVQKGATHHLVDGLANGSLELEHIASKIEDANSREVRNVSSLFVYRQAESKSREFGDGKPVDLPPLPLTQ